MGIYDGILIAENYIDILSKEVTPLYAAMSGVTDDGVLFQQIMALAMLLHRHCSTWKNKKFIF